LSTLVSNEKDQKPFISGSSTNNNANQQFELANASFASGNYALAKQRYVKAKELDMLRFRAPEAMNDIIIKLAEKYKQVHLVDSRKVFEEHSPHQVLGNEILLEHVHPNLLGYALLSDAFYQSLQKAKFIKGAINKEIPLSELINEMPVTKVDSLFGAYTITMLEVGWPFNKPIPADFKRGNSVEEQLAGAISVNRISWMDAMNQLFQYSMKASDKKTSLKAVEAVMLESPQNITYKIYAGRLSFDLGDYANAVYYLKLAYEQDASFENLQNVFLVCLKTDQPDKAIAYIQSAMQMRPQDGQLPKLLSKVQEIIGLKNKLITTPGDMNLKMQIVSDYHTIVADEAGNKYKN
jgi:tetratricopeptide (TPR) repeat protein